MRAWKAQGGRHCECESVQPPGVGRLAARVREKGGAGPVSGRVLGACCVDGVVEAGGADGWQGEHNGAGFTCFDCQLQRPVSTAVT